MELERAAELKRVSLDLIARARRELLLLSRDLDPRLYNNPEVAEALRQFVLRRRGPRVRKLVKDPEPAVRHCHRLIGLAQRLSSFIEIRVPAPEFNQYNKAFIVADSIAYLYRGLADQYEATASLRDPQFAAELTREFNSMWESALPDRAMRRLHL